MWSDKKSSYEFLSASSYRMKLSLSTFFCEKSKIFHKNVKFAGTAFGKFALIRGKTIQKVQKKRAASARARILKKGLHVCAET